MPNDVRSAAEQAKELLNGTTESSETSEAWGPAIGAVRAGLENSIRLESSALEDQRREAKEFAAQTENLTRQIERLAAADDMLPKVPGLEEALNRLQAAGIESSLMFQLLDFQRGTKTAVAAVVEGVLGIDRLATIVVAPKDVERARELTQSTARVRILDAECEAAPTTEKFAQKPIVDFVKVADDRVRAHLVRTLDDCFLLADEPETCSEICWVTGNGRRAEFGARWSDEFEPASWIGKTRRKKARETETKRLQERVTESINRRSACDKVAQDLEKRGQKLRAESAAVSADVVGNLEQLGWKLRRFEEDRQSLETAALELEQDRDAEISRLDVAETALNELAQSTQHAEAEQLTQRLADVDDQLEDCTNRLAESRAEIKSIERRQRGYDESRSAIELELKESTTNTEDAFTSWQRMNPSVDEDSVGGVPRQLAVQIQDAARREESAATRLSGADGVLKEALAARYGFRIIEQDGPFEVVDRQDHSLNDLLAERDQQETAWRETLAKQTRDLFERVLARDLVDRLKSDLERLHQVVHEINTVLEPLVFGHSRFQLRGRPAKDHAELVNLLTSKSADSEAVNRQLRHYLEDRQSELVSESEMPPFLDYRNWFDFSFTLRNVGVESAGSLGSEDMIRGSGGAQGTHHYLLLWALAGLLFNRSNSRLRLLMMDEAFYGLDSERKELLLRCAKQLQLNFVIATPDLDGTVHGEDGGSTTVLVEKDAQDNVSVLGFEWEAQELQT